MARADQRLMFKYSSSQRYHELPLWLLLLLFYFLSPFAASAFGPEVLDMTETGETERQMHTTQLQEQRFASDTKMVKGLPNGMSYSLLTRHMGQLREETVFLPAQHILLYCCFHAVVVSMWE